MDLRKKRVVATLVFPIREGRVLLAKKTRKIGIGYWNGWGGAQEEGETIREAALREFIQESGLTAELEDLKYAGKVVFHNEKEFGTDSEVRVKNSEVEVYIFLLRKWGGTLRPNNEMKNPTFWSIESLPQNMMPSDLDWMPAVFSGCLIDADVYQKQRLDGAWVKTKPTELREVAELGDVD